MLDFNQELRIYRHLIYDSCLILFAVALVHLKTQVTNAEAFGAVDSAKRPTNIMSCLKSCLQFHILQLVS